MLGVNWEELPSMAFNMIDRTIVTYPRHKPINENTLNKWFKLVMSGAYDHRVINK